MKRNVVLCVMILLLPILMSCGRPQGEMSFIGADRAKQLALDACGMDAADAESVTTDMVTHDGQDCYLVDITAAGQSYQLAIDAFTGAIVRINIPGGTESADESSADDAAEGSTEDAAESSVKPGAANEMITVEDAKNKALSHAGLTDGQVTFVESKLDYEDGRQVYEIEFYADDFREYDYEIDACTGEVIGFDYDAEYYAPSQSGNTVITVDEAKKLALEKVPGAAESDIREFETDYEDGHIEYEGKIIYNGMEYEFEIDENGRLLSWEEEATREK